MHALLTYNQMCNVLAIVQLQIHRRRQKAYLARLFTLFALCCCCVGGAELEEEKRVDAFLEKQDYYSGGMKFIDWSREQNHVKFYKDGSIASSST
jgi:hypothetical protein